MKKTLLKILPTILFIFALFALNHAQTLDKGKLDKFFDTLAAKNKAMGSVAIAKDGKIIYSRAVGFRQIGEKESTPADVRTKYRIGSITKMFTAAMIFQLVEEGKLKLTDTLDKYFPEIPNAKKITVAQMLNHHSGIHNITDDAQDYLSYYTKPNTNSEMVARIAKTKPDFEPGAKADYSNSNYILLGYIVEKITGKLYQINLKERITSKIGLNDTYIGGKINAAKDESASYNFVGNWKLQPETDMSVPGGAGAIVSTPMDLTKFIESLFGGKLISQKSLEQMKTIIDDYGMGMFQFPVYNFKAFGHNGGIDGFHSILLYVPEEKLAVAYTSNGMVYPINDILLGIFAVYLNKQFTIPTFETFSVKPEVLENYTGVYSSPSFPLKITVTTKDAMLYAQATGQSEILLEATDTNKFKFDPAGIVVEFNAEKNQMILQQGGQTIVFTKEK